MGRGEGVGSVGAADIARGVGNGLAVVRAVRVIAVFMNALYDSVNFSCSASLAPPCTPLHPKYCHAKAIELTPASAFR